jgi:hypothetical protein
MLSDLKSQVKRKKKKKKIFPSDEREINFLSVVKHTLTKYLHNSNEIEKK